jgi:hypothetical protein
MGETNWHALFGWAQLAVEVLTEGLEAGGHPFGKVDICVRTLGG